MLKNQFFKPVILSLILLSCSGQKGIITLDSLSGDKILIIGVIEYDYAQLQHKNISGIELYIDTKEEISNFKMPDDYLLHDKLKKQKFISSVGDRGEYDLCFKKSISNSTEADNLLIVMDMERALASGESKILQKYSLEGGKIINIGKLIVNYTGGKIEDGKINYSYTFHSINEDTLAIFAFKQSYPTIYDKYKSEIYTFKSEFDSSLEFVLSHISEGKKLRINAFIEDNPIRVEIVFTGLTEDTQDKFVEDIEKFTFEQLEEFLLKSE